MPAEVWAAIIAAVASLIGALYSATKAKAAQRDLAELDDRFQRQRAELDSRLQEQRAERDARRDYEYEAKKRLYTQCEPVIFQAMELAENSRHRVLSLARSARSGDLAPDGTGWLAHTDEYFFTSTAFFLLAPVGRLSGDIAGLIQGFHPATEPVLWRLLVTQYLLHGVFLQTGGDAVGEHSDWSKVLEDEIQAAAQVLGWRSGDHGADAAHTLAIGRDYLMTKLTAISTVR